MKSKVFLLGLFLSFSISTIAQQLTQNIRGRVIDKQSETPLPGVNVYIIGEGSIGTTTDGDGYYLLEKVPVKRVTIAFSFIGYQPVTMQNIELSSSKELVLNVPMLVTRPLGLSGGWKELTSPTLTTLAVWALRVAR